jgi:hypothetical protein
MNNAGAINGQNLELTKDGFEKTSIVTGLESLMYLVLRMKYVPQYTRHASMGWI